MMLNFLSDQPKFIGLGILPYNKERKKFYTVATAKVRRYTGPETRRSLAVLKSFAHYLFIIIL